MKRWLIFVLFFMLALPLMAQTSGTCGDNLIWTITEDTILTISPAPGTEGGKMWNFSGNSGSPWYNKRQSLKKLVIEEGVTSIGNYAFFGCSGFIGELNLPANLTSIGNSAFYYCIGFTGNLILPDGLASIGEYAFDDCSGFTGNLILPTGLTSIGNHAFWNCSGFTGNLILPTGLTSIGSHAFQSCSGFTGDLNLPASLTSIGEYAFYYCSGFTGNLILPDGITSIEGSTFSGCNGFNGELHLPDGLTSIGYYAFNGCRGLTGELNLPDGLTKIEHHAFKGCSGLTGELYLPDGLTSIEAETFCACGFTGELKMPIGLNSIGNNAFGGCGFIGELKLPVSLNTIEKYAFAGCSGLSNIIIPENVKSIDPYAFYGCTEISSIVSRNPVPFKLNNVSFEYSKSTYVHVPLNSVDLYTAADYWKKFTIVGDFRAFFEGRNGQPYTMASVENFNQTIPVPSDPVHPDNYPFLGWYADTSFDINYLWDFEHSTLSSDTTLYALWGDASHTHTVTFNSHNGSDIITETIYTNNHISVEEPSKLGYRFMGWYQGEEPWLPQTPVRESMTIEAHWEIIDYTISYELNGGTNAADNPTAYNIESADIVLQTPVKKGYDFKGWQEGARIEAGSTGDKTFTAQWLPIEYTITYNLNDGENSVDNPVSYNIESPDIVLQSPVKNGYDFMGWQEGSRIEAGSTGDKTFTAQWSPTEYTITYNLNGGTNAADNPIAYTIESATLQIQDPTRPYYAFEGWQEGSQITAGSTGDKTFTAQWSPIEYTITYNLNGGENNSGNPASYNIESAEIVLQSPVKNGYDFIGWQEGSQIAAGSTGNKTFTAQWSPTEYTITYNLNGGTNAADNPIAYTIESATLQLQDPTRLYYTFEGWQEGAQIEAGSTGNKTFTAQWEPIEYSITYKLNGGTNHSGNPASYNFESSDIMLQEPTRVGYTFKGWTEGMRIPTGSNGNKTFTAQWKPIEYTITYNLGGGINHADNPAVYTIESASIALQEPTRRGYEFKGWEEGSQIISGSTGNKTFTAQWEIIEYTIAYANVNAGENPASNPATYTVETPTFSLQNPERAGYNGGWIEDITVPKGSIGNKTFTAQWTPIEYTITYHLGGGTNHADNPAVYTIESATIALEEPTRRGYAFKGWEEGSQIISGSTGNKTFTAQWEIITYTISYANVNAGENPVANPVTYTVETPTFSLQNPERAGYNGGWNEDITVPKGSIGNKTFTAQWSPIEYTITYNLVGGTNHADNPATYNVESASIALQEPTRRGYVFKGWEEGSQIAAGSTGNKTFTAQWEIIEYTIAYANVHDGENPVANPATYTVETPTFSLQNPERAGYNGAWNGDITVPKGSIGNKTFTAQWTPIEYTITYHLGGGTNHADNPVVYTIESVTIALEEPTRRGYAFKGWEEGSQIISGSTGNKTFTAQWEIIEYTITYANVNAGENPASNLTSYTVETPTFILQNPERAGYEGRWSEGGTVTQGSIGNKTFTAQWTPIVYTITYVNVRDEEVPEANPRQYTVESPYIFLMPPLRKGYTGKWIEGYCIEPGSTGNRVFTAQWEENTVNALYFTVEEVGETYIKVSGEMDYTGTVQLGVVIASKESPRITDKDAIVKQIFPNKDFSAVISNLQENTAYCARAFAIHNSDTLYTPSQFFSTKGTSSYYYINILNSATRKPSFVDVLVQVLDDNYQGVGYFRDNDFRILEDGEDNQSTEIHKYVRKMDEIPFEINTMLVLDYTSSLDGDGQNGFAKIKQAAVNTVRNRMANQKFGLVAFYGTNPNVLVPEFTDDTAYLIERINSVERPGSTTALFDAYMKGLDLLPKDSTSTNYIRRDFMVVFTDGLDVMWGTEAGRNKLEAAVEKRRDCGQRVFTIGVYGSDMSSENVDQQDYILGRLASSTSDFYANVDINNIQEIFSEIQMEIRRDANSLYKLTYLTPKREGGHTLSLNLPDVNSAQPSYSFNAQDFESVAYGVFVAPYDADIDAQSPYGIVADKEYAVQADKIFQLTSYWADVVPQYVAASSDTSVIKVEITDFDKLRIVPMGKAGSVVVSIIDQANYDYVSRMRSATIAPAEAAAFKKTFDVSYYGGKLSVAPRKAGFTARFATNGGIPVPVPQFITDGPVEKPAIAPEKKGYRFTGWYKGDEPWDFEERLTENIILTAKWEEKPAIAITTQTPADILQNTATLTGTVDAVSGNYETGFFYDHQYGSYRYKALAESASGELMAHVGGLLANTVYYVQAYAIVGSDTVLGNQTMFTTRPDKEYYQLTGYPPVATAKPYFVDFLFSVKDADGRGVDYLEDYDFVLKNGGITTSKTSEFFRYTRKMDAIPFRIKTVLMLDNSSSISYKDMETLKKAAIDLVKSKHEKQEFAIVSFSESALRSCGFTANTDTLIQQISQIQMGASCTGLYESYMAAVNMLPDEYVTKDSILQCFMVLLSDGDETKNKYTKSLENVASLARGSKTVYTIGFGQDLKPARLRALASSSYNYFPVENLVEVTRVFKDIQYDIMRVANSFYNLTCLTDKRRQHGEIAVDISVGNNTNSGYNNHYTTSYVSVGEEEDDIFWYGTYLNVYQKVADVSMAPLNKYGLGLPDELTSKWASDTINCETLPEDFVLHAVTYGTYVKPKFVWTSSDTSILEVEGYDFDKARLIYKGKNADQVVVTVTDVSNWRAVADYTYKGVVQPRDSALYRRSFYVRNIPTAAPEFVTATLPNGVYGSEYSSVVAVEGRNVTFTLSEGELPSGLSLSPQGVISGVPTLVDTFSFSITASNSAHSVTRDYTIVINKAMGAEVDRPTIEKVRGTYFCIHAVSNPGNGQQVEYSVNTEAVPAELWQDTVLFDGLNYNTSYYVFARAKENDCYYAGAASNYLSVTTWDKSMVDPDLPVDTRDTVKTPVFETPEGTYADSVRIEISCATDGATILYDLYGQTPETVYTEAFYLKKSAMITAMAVKDSMVGSASVAATYIITHEEPVVETVASPVFTPGTGEYEEMVYVTLSCATADATILYSLDGSEPSSVYSSPIKLKETTTVKAMAKKDGMNNSQVVSATYTITHEDPVVETVENPVFAPGAGEYEEMVYVTLSCATADATILYSLDGSEPSSVYSSPIKLKETTTVKAMAKKEGMNNSDVVSAKYIIVANPVMNENAALASVQVYPNPSEGLFTVEVEGDVKAEVYSVRGFRIGLYEWSGAGKYVVDLRGRPAGIYYLRLMAGSCVKTVKLVVM